MAGLAGDVCKVVLSGRYLEQVFQNVFFYRLDDAGTEGYLEGLVSEFQSVVLTALATIQIAAADYTQVYATNIFSGDEFTDDTPTPGQGGLVSSADPVPSFIAACFKLTRSNGRVRHGHKYVGAQTEQMMVQQVWTPEYQALLNAAAPTLAEHLLPGVSADRFIPVIVGRVAYTTTGGSEAYRLPESQAEMGDRWAFVSGASALTGITTMRSRKLGHGI